MNYRHAYHAGNFADVVKHVVLARIVEYLKLKEKAFRVIDTHAGVGLYDLSSDEAQAMTRAPINLPSSTAARQALKSRQGCSTVQTGC